MKLKLSGGLMKDIIMKLLSKLVYEKTGCKINVNLNEFCIANVDGRVSIRLDVNADMADAEFAKLSKTFKHKWN